MKPINVTIYSDPVCPYCYIGADRVRRLQQEYNVPVVWKGFELHPEAPEGGIPPSMFYQNDSHLKRISENARGLAEDAGLILGSHVVYSNSRLALELGEFAEREGVGEAYRKGLFDAYFQQLRDIGDIAVLSDLAENIGLSRADAEKCLAERTMKPVVDEQILEARGYGITGVPTFIIGRYMVVGAQPYEVIKQAFDITTRENVIT
jgi:predicted DsbA family dithiol-disulfide isomerase